MKNSSPDQYRCQNGEIPPMSPDTLEMLASLALYQGHVAGPIYGLDAFVSQEKMEAHFTLVEDLIRLHFEGNLYPEKLADIRYWFYIFFARKCYERWLRNPLLPQKMVQELFLRYIDPNIFNEAILLGVKDYADQEPLVFDFDEEYSDFSEDEIDEKEVP